MGAAVSKPKVPGSGKSGFVDTSIPAAERPGSGIPRTFQDIQSAPTPLGKAQAAADPVRFVFGRPTPTDTPAVAPAVTPEPTDVGQRLSPGFEPGGSRDPEVIKQVEADNEKQSKVRKKAQRRSGRKSTQRTGPTGILRSDQTGTSILGG